MLLKLNYPKKIRVGKGKARNRRYTMRKGPLIIYNKPTSMLKAFRNLPGIELCKVTRLNLLQFAPGGHLGRFVIWTRDAFERLNSLYGTQQTKSKEKKDYLLPRSQMNNTDIIRLMSSDVIRSVIRPRKLPLKFPSRKNSLKNLTAMEKLNPYAVEMRRRKILRRRVAMEKKIQVI